MANGAYIGVDSVARKVKNCYIGVDGIARKVKKAYIGVDGVARLFWQAITTISKYKSATSYNNYVYTNFGDKSTSVQPTGYELFQKRNVYPFCNSSITGTITVDNNGQIISTERYTSLDNTNSNISRANTILVDDNNIFSLSSYVDYKYSDWYNKVTGAKSSSVENSTSGWSAPVAATGDGYVIGLSDVYSTSMNYNINVIYTGSAQNVTYSGTSVPKKITESSNMHLVMLTPTKGVVHEWYNDSQKLFIRSFSRSGTQVTVQKVVEITQVSGFYCRGVKMVDKNHFFAITYDKLAYYHVDDNYNISFIGSIPFTTSSIETICRVGITNSFVLPERTSSTVHLVSFTDAGIVNNGSYTSTLSARYNTHTFPFGDNSVIIFSAGSSAGYIKSTIETFE